MGSRELSLMKLENQNESDCLFLDDQLPLGTWDQPFASGECYNFGEPGLFEFDTYSSSQITKTSPIELNDFEEICGDLALWDFTQPSFHNDASFVIPNQVIMPNDQIIDQFQCGHSSITYHSSTLTSSVKHQNLEMSTLGIKRQHGRRYKSSTLELDEIQKYFDMPITRAAKELNVGLTVLKKRCRELNIMRWPHRKIKSLKSLIHNVKELGLTGEIEMLEEHKRMVETIPEMELTERTKKLRQACFKANYKKRRALQNYSGHL